MIDSINGFNVLNFTNSFVFVAAFFGSFYAVGLLTTLLVITLTALCISAVCNIFLFGAKRMSVPKGAKASVLITGCSRGFGRQAALTLHRDGFTVFAGVRRQDDAKSLLADRASTTSNDAKLIPVILDVTNEDQIAQARDTIDRHLASNDAYLHAVINNAGYGEAGPIEMLTTDAMRRQFDVNVVGQVLVAQAFLPLLRASKNVREISPRLVFISSAVGFITLPGSGIYAASKHAVEAIVDSMRAEVGPEGIDVVAVEPGAFATNFLTTIFDTGDTNLQSKNKWADEKTIDRYQRVFAATKRQREKIPQASSLEPVIDAMRDSLLHRKPMVRYRSGIDSQFGVALQRIFPDRLFDMILGKNFSDNV
jgi:NAD(P)-dependent dehydrogenase (short-subunit alcohol dehydrogenase family)